MITEAVMAASVENLWPVPALPWLLWATVSLCSSLRVPLLGVHPVEAALLLSLQVQPAKSPLHPFHFAVLQKKNTNTKIQVTVN